MRVRLGLWGALHRAASRHGQFKIPPTEVARFSLHLVWGHVSPHGAQGRDVTVSGYLTKIQIEAFLLWARLCFIELCCFFAQ